MKLFRSEEELRAARNERLVNRDFPWLWAIRNQWVLAFDKITVENVALHECPNSLMNLLNLPTAMSRKTQVWIRYEAGIVTGVKKVAVDPNADPVPNWAKAICDALGCRETILNIIVAFGELPLHSLTVTVYRQKESGYFNRLLEHITGTRVTVRLDWMKTPVLG